MVYRGPKAPRRCAQADCRNRHPCSVHPWGWDGYRQEDGKHPLPKNWNSLVSTIWEAANGKCNKCGADCRVISIGGSVDHIIPRSRGGTSDISNLQLLCNPCHKAKSRKERLWRGKQRPRGMSS